MDCIGKWPMAIFPVLPIVQRPFGIEDDTFGPPPCDLGILMSSLLELRAKKNALPTKMEKGRGCMLLGSVWQRRHPARCQKQWKSNKVKWLSSKIQLCTLCTVPHSTRTQWDILAIFGSLQDFLQILGPEKVYFFSFGAILGDYSNFGAKYCTYFFNFGASKPAKT